MVKKSPAGSESINFTKLSAEDMKQKLQQRVTYLKGDGFGLDDKLSYGDIASQIEQDFENVTEEKKILFWKKDVAKTYLTISIDGQDLGYFDVDSDGNWQDQIIGFTDMVFDLSEDVAVADHEKATRESLDGIVTKEAVSDFYKTMTTETSTVSESGKEARDAKKETRKGDREVKAKQRELRAELGELMISMQKLGQVMKETQIKNFYKRINEYKTLLDEIDTTSGSFEDGSLNEVAQEIAIMIVDGYYDAKSFKTGKVGFLRKHKVSMKDEMIAQIVSNITDPSAFERREQYLEAVDKFKEAQAKQRGKKNINRRLRTTNDMKRHAVTIAEYEGKYPTLSLLTETEKGEVNTALNALSKRQKKNLSKASGGAVEAFSRSAIPAGIEERLSGVSFDKIPSGADPYSYYIMSMAHVFDESIISGADGSRGGSAKKGTEYSDVPGIVVSLDRNGIPHVTIDRSKLPPKYLAEGYFVNKHAASLPGSTRKASYDKENYAFGIVDEIMQHPRHKELILAELTSEGASGRDELRMIVDDLFFDDAFKGAIHRNYKSLMRQCELGDFPPEWDKHDHDAKGELSDNMLEIAFKRQFPAKYKAYSKLFERHTNGDKSAGYSTDAKIQNFLDGMGVTDTAAFVRDSMGSKDIEDDITYGDAWRQGAISGDGGAIDMAALDSIEAIRNTELPDTAKAFAETVVHSVKKGSKFVMKYLPGGLLVFTGFRAITGSIGAVKALFRKPGENESRIGNFMRAFKDGVVGRRKAGENREWYEREGGIFAPGAAYLTLTTLDKKPGTEGIRDTVLGFFDDDAKARNTRRDKIDAISSANDESVSITQGIKNTVGTYTMKELMDTSKPILSGSAGKMHVNFVNVDPKRLSNYLPTKTFKNDGTQLATLGTGFGNELIKNYNLDPDRLNELAKKYPDTQLNVLLKRYTGRIAQTEMLAGSLRKELVFTEDQVHELRYMDQNEFNEKVKTLAFVGQQINKFRPTQLDSYIKSRGGGFKMPLTTTAAGSVTMSAAGIVGEMMRATDSSGKSAEDRLRGRLQEIVEEKDPSKIKDLMTGYFKVLKSTASQNSLMYGVTPASGGTATPTEALWKYDTDFADTLAGYFHNPAIGNGVGKAELIRNPQRGAKAQFGADPATELGSSPDYGTGPLAATWDTISK